MSVVTTTVTVTPRITPFTGLSEMARERSGIARAEVVYSSKGLWDQAGAGNSRGLIFNWDLDPDYGYVLMDCNALFLIAADQLTMKASSWMQITQELPGTDEDQYYQLESLPGRMNNSGGGVIGDMSAVDYNNLYPSGTDVGSMAFNMKYKPTGLLYPFPQVSLMSCSTVFGDFVNNEPQVGYRYYCRFLQYDITQGYNYIINSPALTR
jgi:hypothetical protein